MQCGIHGTAASRLSSISLPQDFFAAREALPVSDVSQTSKRRIDCAKQLLLLVAPLEQ
jgi:hypothetical protein